MDINEIKHYLPHRYPFLLVDRVTEIESGDHIVGYKNITANEEVFNGHFPQAPIFPGVMIVEALAQISGILGFADEKESHDENTLYLFAGVDGVRFRRQVVPGDKLVLESRLLSRKRHILKFEAKATVDGELACQATLMCALKQV
ncbi:3-hydroxyacyl-ACP dehydratase FabZ [Porticoccus sp. W117]|uniref:3-hydroxyacyl-ACP dehydratase FabZ n=1 Tax=Porticoccus sp. W117 TaxID=3054777 RepID=UPI002595E115|nr:3-hydroxyacyl-ACP dehydratase FabZ [Porticoccus sp. W117]MDM3870273.1 3-hydroxyacyl-ACP dehydratase FabZ [Porticoccus sp. W117]